MKRILLMVVFVFCFINVPTTMASGSSFVVIDAKTGRVLQGMNEQQTLPIASLTKIWTALIVIENSDLQKQIRIPREATLAEGSSIYLQQDELVTIEQLLHGLLLRSGNDAAYALANYVGGSEEGFVQLMNEKAQYYGLKQTHFTNASGLHNDQHLSSALDTARMLQIAMNNEQFRNIASSRSYKGTIVWSNKHRLLHENIGALAGKTGYTKVAGRTLATYFEREDKQLVIVTLNEGNDWAFHRSMADLIDHNYEQKTIVKKGSYVAGPVKVKVGKSIKLLVSPQEQQQLQHIWQVKREHPQEVVWHIYINNQRVYSQMVERVK